MFGTLINTIGEKKDELELKVTLYIIIGIVAIVIISVLIDGIRRYIRGLDTAALGGLLVWVGHKIAEIKVIGVVSKLLYLVGGTLLAVGLLVFIVLQLFKRRKNRKIARQSNREQRPENTGSGNDETSS